MPSQVAQAATPEMLDKYSDRARRAATEGLIVQHVVNVPGVLAVRHRVKGTTRVHHVLAGMHRGMNLYDDDCERTPPYTPPGTNLVFRLARGASFVEHMPGFVPIACTCKDFVVRGTSTAAGATGVRSLDDSGGRAGDRIMGAIFGCKHMLAADEFMMGGRSDKGYFSVGQPTAAPRNTPQ